MDKYDFLRDVEAVKNIPDTLPAEPKQRKKSEKDEAGPSRRKIKTEGEDRPTKMLKIRPSSDELVSAPLNPTLMTPITTTPVIPNPAAEIVTVEQGSIEMLKQEPETVDKMAIENLLSD